MSHNTLHCIYSLKVQWKAKQFWTVERIIDWVVLAGTVMDSSGNVTGEVVWGSTASNGFRVDWEGRLFSWATAGSERLSLQGCFLNLSSPAEIIRSLLSLFQNHFTSCT